MKKVLIIGIFLSLTVFSFSQVNVGIKGGLNFSKFNADVLETAEYRLTTYDGRKAGYHIGLFTRIELFGMFVQPELIYSLLRSEIQVFNLATQTEVDVAQVQISRFDIPALVGATVGPIRLAAGPVASFNLTNRTQLEDLTGYIPEIRKAMFGYQVGAGFNLSSFTVDLRYEGNLTKLGDSIEVGGETINFDRRTNQVILSVGLSF
jgi:opacity protein-like surface antigen